MNSLRNEKLLIIVAFSFALSCGERNVTKSIYHPAAPLLISPINNSDCEVVPADDNGVFYVNFNWELADYTDSYIVVVKDLESGSIANETNTETNEISLPLHGGRSYGWSVTSISEVSTVTSQSEEWRFYLTGDPVNNYPPFPAQVIYPQDNIVLSLAETPVSFTWEGSDLDEDIVEYDVFLGTNPKPELFSEGLRSPILDSVPFIEKGIYYWQIKTLDSAGNSSLSKVFTLIIN